MGYFVKYAGLIGYQPDFSNYHSIFIRPLDKPGFSAFVSDGLCTLPIKYFLIDTDDIGNRDGRVSHMVRASHAFFAEWIQLDSDGLTIQYVDKSKHAKLPQNPDYYRIPISTNLTDEVVTGENPSLCEYLTAMVRAKATTDQIDAFVVEYGIGSGVPFMWIPACDLAAMVTESRLDGDKGRRNVDLMELINQRAETTTFGKPVPLRNGPPENVMYALFGDSIGKPICYRALTDPNTTVYGVIQGICDVESVPQRATLELVNEAMRKQSSNVPEDFEELGAFIEVRLQSGDLTYISPDWVVSDTLEYGDRVVLPDTPVVAKKPVRRKTTRKPIRRVCE